ncbi:MAG: Peptidase inhibitor, partial [Actinomycetota bacterium]
MKIRRHLSLLISLAFVVVLAPVAPAAAVAPATTSGSSKDFIVILTDGASVAAKVSKEASLGNDVSDVFRSKVKGFVAELDAADVRRLKQDPQVLIVEPDSVMSVIDTQEPSTTTSSTSSTSSTSTTSTTSSTSTTMAAISDDPLAGLSIGDAIPNQYIVTLRSGVSATAFAAAQADSGITILGTPTAAINGFGAQLSKDQLSLLASDPNVLLI